MLLTFLLAMLAAAVALPVVIWSVPGEIEEEDRFDPGFFAGERIDLARLDEIAPEPELDVISPQAALPAEVQVQAEIEDIASEFGAGVMPEEEQGDDAFLAAAAAAAWMIGDPVQRDPNGGHRA